MNASLQAHRIETTLTQDGTLTLDHLPFRAGEGVEVIVLLHANALPQPGAENMARTDADRSGKNLVEELKARIRFDNCHSWIHLLLAFFLTIVSVLASFGAAILVAFHRTPLWITVSMSAIPGTLILIDRSFSFFKRSRWHCWVVTRLKAFAREIEHEGSDTATVSKRFSEFMIEAESHYPGLGADGLADARWRLP